MDSNNTTTNGTEEKDGRIRKKESLRIGTIQPPNRLSSFFSRIGKANGSGKSGEKRKKNLTNLKIDLVDRRHD